MSHCQTQLYHRQVGDLGGITGGRRGDRGEATGDRTV